MQLLRAVVLGATGLIGEQLVQQLLNNAAFSKVRILVRRKVELSHPKLEVIIVNFSNLSDFRAALGDGDCIFCCIGTTQKKVKGDKAAYRAIDVDIPVNAAKMGVDAAFTSYLLVSSVGANARSGNFYLQLKGEVEKEIASLNFPWFHVFRPSILLGERKEFRFAESIGKGFVQGISPLLSGGLKKYRGIDAADVAKAMVAAAKTDTKGMFVHHYEDIMKLASRL
jgi:uncharacterized protein YbjT (DUF2867 family)